jgi:hypothetical protein
LALAVGTVAHAQQWWKMSDADFAKAYVTQALNSAPGYQQDAVAWMLFARLSQPATYNNTQYTTWELWPSDPETFHPPSARAFAAVGKVRSGPILQRSKVSKVLGAANPHATAFNPALGGEEVTRNPTSYGYITGNQLTTKAGVTTYLTNNKGGLNFPVGTVETKAVWTTTQTGMAGAYSVADASGTLYYLQSLHVMAKFKLITPGQQFTSTDAWLWTTFEFNGNPGLTHAQGLLNVKDSLPVAARQELLRASGIVAAFPNLAKNYVCNGVQTTFVNPTNNPVLLGNTLLENFGFAPATATSPAQYTSWKISCHTCHGEASAKLITGNPNSVSMQNFGSFKLSQGNVGTLPPAGEPSMLKDFISLDFNWAIVFNAQ